MNAGAEVIDVSDKLNPVAKGYVSLPDGANGIKVVQNHAFVADYINGGVQVVNVTDPDNIFVDGYYQPSGCFALGVNVVGNNIYLADGAGGFQIYSTTLITGTGDPVNHAGANISAYPNPFRDHVVIRIAAQDAEGGLSVFDVSGRLVTNLSVTTGSAGQQCFCWDGKTQTGTEAKPGMYYYSNKSGSASGKLAKVQ